MSAEGKIIEAASLMTHDQAAAYLHVCPKTLRSIRQRGLIRYVALTERKIVYRREDCDAFVASRLTTEVFRPTENRKPPKLRASGNVVSFSERRQQRVAERGR